MRGRKYFHLDACWLGWKVVVVLGWVDGKLIGSCSGSDSALGETGGNKTPGQSSGSDHGGFVFLSRYACIGNSDGEMQPTLLTSQNPMNPMLTVMVT